MCVYILIYGNILVDFHWDIITILNLAGDEITGTPKKASERMVNTEQSDTYYPWVAYIQRTFYVHDRARVEKTTYCAGGIITWRYELEFKNIFQYINLYQNFISFHTIK